MRSPLNHANVTKFSRDNVILIKKAIRKKLWSWHVSPVPESPSCKEERSVSSIPWRKKSPFCKVEGPSKSFSASLVTLQEKKSPYWEVGDHKNIILQGDYLYIIHNVVISDYQSGGYHVMSIILSSGTVKIVVLQGKVNRIWLDHMLEKLVWILKEVKTIFQRIYPSRYYVRVSCIVNPSWKFWQGGNIIDPKGYTNNNKKGFF